MTTAHISLGVWIIALGMAIPVSLAQTTTPATQPAWTAQSPAVEAMQNYFRDQVGHLEGKLLEETPTRQAWLYHRDEYRRQLAEMLGLDPMPAKSDLHAVVTGQVEQEGIIVEKLYYQSLPGLYVTANLYRPAKVDHPLPTILYVCGHGRMVKDGVSFGNKTSYEHHGIWYAQHGFVCLTIDTVELGEIMGVHHGTYNLGRWWWISRGYTPAGVEALAGIRGIDYLQTRHEVDMSRLGLTGRSGGGAYSWFIAALDDRVKVVVPTAGITDLHNYVVDGCVEGHCDCMFFANTYRWDYDKLAALIAPRPLCIANTDKDTIFPLDGVYRIYQSTRRIYRLLDAEKNIGLQIAEGPHADTQPLNTGEFHWMMRFLQNTKPLDSFDTHTAKSIDPAKLRAFDKLPTDERNTRIDESFVPFPPAPEPPKSVEQWATTRDAWLKALREKCFAGWSTGPMPTPATVNSFERQDVAVSTYLLKVDGAFDLKLLIARPAHVKPAELELVVLNMLDQQDWEDLLNAYGPIFPEAFAPAIAAKPDAKAFDAERKMFGNFKWAMAYICPRGIGPTRWDDQEALNSSDAKTKAAAEKNRTHRLRRFYLLGQTLEGQQVYDIRCAIRGLRSIEGFGKTPLWLQGDRFQAANALYASLFEDNITRLDLHDLPHSHRQGPTYLNVLRVLDLPQAAALAAERTRVVIYDSDAQSWSFVHDTAQNLGWSKANHNGLQIREAEKSEKDKESK